MNKKINTIIFLLIILLITFLSLSIFDIIRSKNAKAAHGTVDSAINMAVDLNTSTFTKILDATRERSVVELCNDSIANKIYINLAPTGDGVDEAGRPLKGGECWKMSEDNVFIEEISAIADTGNPKLTIIQY